MAHLGLLALALLFLEDQERVTLSDGSSQALELCRVLCGRPSEKHPKFTRVRRMR